MPPARWNSGDRLWFMDIIAPFGHGRTVANFVARNPPEEPFWFARVGSEGKIFKVVEGDASRGRRGLVRAFQLDDLAGAA